MSHIVSTLIRNNHVNVLEYGYSMFINALKELSDSTGDALKNNAIAHRLAGAKQDDWEKIFPKEVKKVVMKKEDHLSQIARVQGLTGGR